MRTKAKRALVLGGGMAAGSLSVSLLIWAPWLFEGRHVRDPSLAPSAGIIITGFRTTLVALAAGVVAAFGLWYTHRNHRLSQQQFKQAQEQFTLTQNQFEHTQAKDREQADLTREGQVAERYVDAIKLLGSENMTERLGGIYSLERIMRDSAKDYNTIIEVLAAFIRQRAKQQQDSPAEDPTGNPRDDVQAALTALCRRPARKEKMSVDLRRVDLRNAQFVGPFLDGASPVADLRGFQFDLSWLQGAQLPGARLDGASLRGARLDQCNLVHSELNGALLYDAVLSGANLMNAKLNDARLWGCHMANVRLGSRRKGTAASLQGADLREVTGLTADALSGAHIYRSTAIPPELAAHPQITSRIAECEGQGATSDGRSRENSSKPRHPQ